MNNKLEGEGKHNVLIVSAVFRALTENHMKILRRLKLHREGIKPYRMYPKRKAAIKEMQDAAIKAVTSFFLSLPGTQCESSFLDIAGSVLYSEDILVLGRVDWRTYETKNDFNNMINRRNLSAQHGR